jgi:hypothetical protein
MLTRLRVMKELLKHKKYQKERINKGDRILLFDMQRIYIQNNMRPNSTDSDEMAFDVDPPINVE